MNNGGIDYYRSGNDIMKRMTKGSLCINSVSSGTISVSSTYEPQAYNMQNGHVTPAGKRYTYNHRPTKETYDYAPWCYVQTDFYSYIKIVAYEHDDNSYNAGCKYIPYTKEDLQKIRDTFERQVILHYGSCKVMTTLHSKGAVFPWV